MTNRNLDDMLNRSRPATAEADPDLLFLIAPMSEAARAEAKKVRVRPRATPAFRRPSRPLLAVALGASLLLAGGALVEGIQPNYEARTTIVLSLPGDPFLDDGDSAPAECLATLIFDVSGGAAEQDKVEAAVQGHDWSGLESQAAALVQSDRGDPDLNKNVVATLDAGVRATLDPQLVGFAQYGGVGLRCEVAK
ncbi:hypothetical protein [Frigoribacterium sp. PvP032]|uniref:hypothetical protein n=1 Tax=Frigoribacterium sp. PvP032 TaxID=2806589 RepID=UPI001AE90E60|nr:hypothetical protein [Frigoribacterium sp. PvP032]MBP1190893.1 hypothetical protein [Frigoribacterium sp. PvP032]